VLQVFGSRVRRGSRSRWITYRWRAAVLAFVIPGILCASVVKLARASSHKPQPILCDGVDDDADGSAFCGLPAESTKKSSLMILHPLLAGTISSPALRPHVAHLRPQRVSSTRSPRFKRLLSRHLNSSTDPDGAH
jgi:hypothetical protein